MTRRAREAWMIIGILACFGFILWLGENPL